ncbi:heavy-metal-associated domain-containing protein [Mycetocola sp.]|uniref:heavy-metal-associated domain-containing protein n=1 Tax=Mycetocola sp. TaxID=1871042 RepID=UPI003988AD1D
MGTTNTTNDLGLTDLNSGCTGATHSDSTHEHSAAHSTAAHREHYFVNGMTCSHCVTSVTEELSALPGVESVKVRLNAGGTSQVMVESRTALDVDVVRAAVDEAGYELAGEAK